MKWVPLYTTGGTIKWSNFLEGNLYQEQCLWIAFKEIIRDT